MKSKTNRRTRVGDKSLRSLSLGQLLKADLPVREYILHPLLKQGESLMLWAAPGVGKTMVALSIALAAAGAGNFLGWKAPRPCKVLYVDGEMAIADLRDRLTALLGGLTELDRTSAEKNLRLLARSYQEPEVPFPDIAEPAGQQEIFSRARGIRADLVILDNFSVLAGVSDENDAAAMQPVLEFLLRMKQAGIATLLVHHSNKSGADYRGSSKIATTFETIVGLTPKFTAKSSNGAAIDLTFTKFRGMRNETIVDTTAWLEIGSDGAASWQHKQSESVVLARLAALIRECRFSRQEDLAEDMGFSTGKLSQLKHMAIAQGYIGNDEWRHCMSAARAAETADESDEAAEEFA